MYAYVWPVPSAHATLVQSRPMARARPETGDERDTPKPGRLQGKILANATGEWPARRYDTRARNSLKSRHVPGSPEAGDCN